MQNAERRDNIEKKPLCASTRDIAAKSSRLGVLLCLISTTLFSFSNVFLRQLGALGVSHSWTICVKEIFTISCLTPVIFFLAIRGKYQWPKLKWVGIIFFGGFCCQYIGARLHLHAFAVLGLVVSVPLLQASNMVFAAVLGRGFLGERVGQRSRVAMFIMLVAMSFLVFGPNKPDTEQSTQTIARNVLLLAGIGTVVAGFAYSIHVVLMRWASNGREMPITFLAVQITGIGAVIFGCEFLRDNGWQISAFWKDITPQVWRLIVLTGFFNMAAFLFQITGLRYTMVARAQMIGVAQIVIGTLFGVFFFQELTNAMIWLGVSLTVLGIYFVSTPGKK